MLKKTVVDSLSSKTKSDEQVRLPKVNSSTDFPLPSLQTTQRMFTAAIVHTQNAEINIVPYVLKFYNAPSVLP